MIDVSTSNDELTEKIRPESLFRSGQPDYFPASGVLCNCLVFDLRSPEEIDTRDLSNPSGLWSLTAGESRQLSYLERLNELGHGTDVRIAVVEDYLKVFRASRLLLSEAITLAASDSRDRIWVRCNAGKDRTGIFIALMLRLLDISLGAIETDYGRAVDKARSRSLIRLSTEIEAAGEDSQRYLGLVFPCHSVIRLFLEEVECNYGSVAAALWGDRTCRRDIVQNLKNKLLRS